jgi:hypothetical protein
MVKGVLGVPVTALVTGSVVWYVKLAGRAPSDAMLQPAASPVPDAITVAKAVAGVPIVTERLLGKTAADKLGALEETAAMRTSSKSTVARASGACGSAGSWRSTLA